VSPPADIPAAYLAHPFLDPALPHRQPAIARLWIATWRELRRDPAAYERMLEFYTRPARRDMRERRSLSRYFQDADVYLDDLLRLAPEETARYLRVSETVRQLHDIAGLVETSFDAGTARLRYEAQRKLYLAKLLFDIDHCRSVRDGLRHKEQWEALLDEIFWPGAQETGEVGVAAGFKVLRLPRRHGETAIDVHLYKSRFKKETEPARDVVTAGGLHRVEETPRWPGLGRRSGSILSKMIRRGIGDPRLVHDLLGAMFIVGSRQQAYGLERRLVHVLGGPFRFRDRVDTLQGERDRGLLDPRSSAGFQVLKQIVDVLMPDPAGDSPYLFPVEVQVYPLEAYLRTLHDAHYASHTAYKQRQFLLDLLPALFPEAVYGSVPHDLSGVGPSLGPVRS
jgi:hypothetical protein